VLLPNDPENYYRQRDIVSAQQQEQLGQAKIIITNYHAFQLREKIAAGKITKSILSGGQPSPFTETPDQMVRRVCRELSTKKNIIVLNDEAHHCYRRKPDSEMTLSLAMIASKPRSATKKPASGFRASKP
jgi:type III restriction enzyme